MQSKETFLAALLCSFGFVGLQGTASAAVATQHGVVCKAFNGANDFKSLIEGFKNTSSNSREAICPLVRAAPVEGTTFSIYIDGKFPSGSGSCTLYSYSYTGVLLGSVSTATLTGAFDALVSLPASAVPSFSYQAVYCKVPGKGVIWGINPIF